MSLIPIYDGLVAHPVAVVLFTRDLRVHDHPALRAATLAAERVAPLFVADPRVPSSPNRQRFLAECLSDLRESLRARGGDLIMRYGDPVTEAVALARQVGATQIVVGADVSRYATTRQRRLDEAARAKRLELTLVEGSTVVPPGALRPSGGGDHYRVFTPYWRAWRAIPHRRPLPPPRHIRLPAGVPTGDVPEAGPGGSPNVLPAESRPRGGDWPAGGAESSTTPQPTTTLRLTGPHG